MASCRTWRLSSYCVSILGISLAQSLDTRSLVLENSPLVLKIEEESFGRRLLNELNYTDDSLGIKNKADYQVYPLNQSQNQKQGINLIKVPNMEMQSIEVPRMELSALEWKKVDPEWTQDLRPDLKARLEVAQRDSKVLDQDWSAPEFKDLVAEIEPELAEEVFPERKLWGDIRLVDGAALGDRQLKIYWAGEGEAIRPARVDLDRAQYFFDSLPSHGVVRGEIFDQDGIVVAEAAVPLSLSDKNVSQDTNRSFSLNQPLSFKPVSIHPRVFAEALAPQKIVKSIPRLTYYAPTGQKISEHQLHPATAFVAKLEAKGYVPTLMSNLDGGFVRGSDAESLFPADLVKAWEKSVDMDFTDEQQGFVFGRILHDGVPVAGAQVKWEPKRIEAPLSDQSETFGQALYLRGWLPDKALQETDTNGEFLMVQVPAGLYEVTVFKNQKIIGQQLVLVGPQAASRVLFRGTTRLKWREVYVSEAFSGKSLDVKIEQVEKNSLPEASSLPVSLYTQEQSGFWISEGAWYSTDWSVVPSGSDHLETLFSPPQHSPHFSMRLLPKAWWEILLKEASVSAPSPFSKALVVFMSRGSNQYQNVKLQAHQRMIYFDETGKWTDRFQPKGGMIIFGLAPNQEFLELGLKSGRVLFVRVPQGAGSLGTVEVEI